MKKSYVLRMDEDLHRDLKTFAAGRQMRMGDYVIEALKSKLAKDRLAVSVISLRNQEKKQK